MTQVLPTTPRDRVSVPSWEKSVQEYRFSFPNDRNDLLKCRRRGDLNKRRASQMVVSQKEWLGSEGAVVMVSCVAIGPTREEWHAILVGGFVTKTDSQRDAVCALADELMSRAMLLPSDALALAQDAAKRQASKTREDVLAWIDRVVEDVKRAND